MRIEVTATPALQDEHFVASQVQAFNARFMPADFQPVAVFARDEQGTIAGGLLGRTYWGWLDIVTLWVDPAHRQQGLATRLIAAAEAEAHGRGCTGALVDTFSFQALGFYRKQGYEVFGQLEGFAGGHERYYLRKRIGPAG